MKVLDVVRLKDGREVTLLDEHEDGTFLAEYCDKNGSTLDTPIVKESEVACVVFSS